MILRGGTTVKKVDFFGGLWGLFFSPTLEPPLKITSCLIPQRNSGFFSNCEIFLGGLKKLMILKGAPV